MRGKNDIFFYEYIQDTVGDKILPFLLYYPSKYTLVYKGVKLKLNFKCSSRFST